jgi:hypothetical protein
MVDIQTTRLIQARGSLCVRKFGIFLFSRMFLPVVQAQSRPLHLLSFLQSSASWHSQRVSLQNPPRQKQLSGLFLKIVKLCDIFHTIKPCILTCKNSLYTCYTQYP